MTGVTGDRQDLQILQRLHFKEALYYCGSDVLQLAANMHGVTAATLRKAAAVRKVRSSKELKNTLNKTGSLNTEGAYDPL